MITQPRRFNSSLLSRAGFCFAVCIAAVLVLPSKNGLAADSENWASKMFPTKSHDFRTVGRGTKCEFYFEFTNLYEDEVHVAAVRSSCGCTTPTVTEKTIGTREKSAVVATYNTSSFIGKKAATITVVFDRPYYAEVQLKVEGFIRTDITFDPPEVAFGEIGSGETTQQDIVITHTGNSSWQITDVRSHCDDLQVQLSEPTRTSGMVRYRMRVNVLSSMPEGDVRERLTLISNDPEFPTTEMSINGRIRPSVSVSPAAVSLGTVMPGATIEKRLVVRGEEPFEIKEVICGDTRFDFETPKGSKKLHFVKLKFTAGNLPQGKTNDRVAQEILVATTMKDGKSATCVATGIIAN
ncbi:MAG: DUF1573 domain-containing protein [Planctomycetota bacterium]